MKTFCKQVADTLRKAILPIGLGLSLMLVSPVIPSKADVPASSVKPRTIPLAAAQTPTSQTTVVNATTNAIGLTSPYQHELQLWQNINGTNASNVGSAVITNVIDFAYDSAGTKFTTNAWQWVPPIAALTNQVVATNAPKNMMDGATAIRWTKLLGNTASTNGTGLNADMNYNITP